MSNIEKIRQEIERRKKRWMYDDLPIAMGRYYEDRDLLAFIDSLAEEKPSDDLEEEIQGMYQAIFGTDIINRREMVYLETFDMIARHFAEWGAKHKDSLQVQETCKENQDSFTDEPKEMSVDEAMKYIDEKIAKTRASKSWELVDIDKFMDEIRGRELDDLEDFDSMPEEIPPYVTGFKGEPDPLGICDLEKAAGRCGFDYVDNIVQETPEHRWNDHDVEFGYRDGFIAGAKWMEIHMPMPEDTVIFMKGVAEGRRLEREDRNDDNLPRYYGD